MAEICQEFLPRGVLNVLTRFGRRVPAEPLAEHPLVRKTLLSPARPEVGKIIMRAAAELFAKPVNTFSTPRGRTPDRFQPSIGHERRILGGLEHDRCCPAHRAGAIFSPPARPAHSMGLSRRPRDRLPPRVAEHMLAERIVRLQLAGQPAEIAKDIGRQPRLGPRLSPQGMAGLQRNRAGEFLVRTRSLRLPTTTRGRGPRGDDFARRPGRLWRRLDGAVSHRPAVSPRGTSAIGQRFAGFSTLQKLPDMLSTKRRRSASAHGQFDRGHGLGNQQE